MFLALALRTQVLKSSALASVIRSLVLALTLRLKSWALVSVIRSLHNIAYYVLHGPQVSN